MTRDIRYEGQRQLQIDYTPPHVDDPRRRAVIDIGDRVIDAIEAGEVSLCFVDRDGRWSPEFAMPISVARMVRDAIDTILDDRHVQASSRRKPASLNELQDHVRRSLRRSR